MAAALKQQLAHLGNLAHSGGSHKDVTEKLVLFINLDNW